MRRRLHLSTPVILCLLAEMSFAQPAGPPPAPIVRAVPPGMEQMAAAQAEAAAPRPDAHWRSGFTLRAGFGVGSFIAARSTVERSSSTTVTLGLGGFATKNLAIYLQLEGTSGGDDDLMTEDLGFVGLTADYFLTDRLVLGGGVGQTQTTVRVPEVDGYLWPEGRDGFGAQGRASYVLTQRRKHALDLTGAVTTGVFDRLQVTTANLQIAYRFL